MADFLYVINVSIMQDDRNVVDCVVVGWSIRQNSQYRGARMTGGNL